jgi:hypothetical protein
MPSRNLLKILRRLKTKTRSRFRHFFWDTSYQKINTIFFVLIFAMILFFLFTKPEEIELVHCTYKSVLGQLCYTCGLTHSFYEIVRFNFSKAIQKNPDSILVFIFFVIQMVARMTINAGIYKSSQQQQKIAFFDIVFSLLLLFLCFWNIFV